MKVVDMVKESLIIRFRIEKKEEFYDVLNKVKAGVVGRVWDPNLNAWVAPATTENVNYLRSLGFVLTNAVRTFMGEPVGRTIVVPAQVSSPPVTIDVEKLKGLFGYQIEGVRFLEQRQGIGIIGDEMGLGKTVQALGYLRLHPELSPVLVICPAVAKYVWYEFAQRWLQITSEDVCVLSSRQTNGIDLLNKKRLYVINYDVLKDWEELLLQVGFKVVIGDEVQYVSNIKAKRTKAFVRIARRIPKRIFLSGTPIKSFPSEFFTVLNLVEPKVFSNRWEYLQRYCNPRHNGFGWVFRGASNQDELRKLITPLMLRREKQEVLVDLPPKLLQVVPLECEEIQLKAYEDADREFREWVIQNLTRKVQTEARNRIEHLKQLAYIAKRNAVIQWIRDFLESGKKLVVFGVHLRVLDDIEHMFADVCVRVDGHTKPEDRKLLEQKFQNDPSVQLFVGQVIAAGVALTLTAASSVAFVELPWTTADLDQAADRCHRIGQKDVVSVYFLIAKDTVEEKIMRYLDRKRTVVRKLLDGKEVESEDLLESLLVEYSNR